MDSLDSGQYPIILWPQLRDTDPECMNFTYLMSPTLILFIQPAACSPTTHISTKYLHDI